MAQHIYIYEDYPRTIPVKFNWPRNLEVVWTYNNIIQCKFATLWTTSVEDLMTSRWCYLPEIKTQGLVIADFWKLNILNPLSDPRPTYAINQYRLNNCSGALRIIPVKFGSNLVRNFRDVSVKMLTHNAWRTNDKDLSQWQTLS